MLSDLTPEILLEISDYLYDADYCCLGACSRQFYGLLARQIIPWQHLASDDESSIILRHSLGITSDKQFSLITRLERDLPSYFACRVCNILHRFDESVGLALSGIYQEITCPLPCIKAGKYWLQDDKYLTLHHHEHWCQRKFTFLHLKLAMRAFKYGPEYGISTDSLSYTQVTVDRRWRTRATWLISQEAQILTESLGLYIRVQDIMLFPEWRFLLNQEYGSWPDPSIFCVHIGIMLFEHVIPILRALDRGFLKSKNGDRSKALYERDMHCRVCHLRLNIELCEIDSQKAFITTRWVDLGLGLDDENSIWKTHTLSSPEPHTLEIEVDPNDPPLEPKSPRQHFEETAPQSFKELRLRNLSYLKDKQYTRIMRFIPGTGVWHNPFREPCSSRIINFWLTLLAFLGFFTDRTPKKRT